MERVDLGALNRIVEHTPEDMTVTVEAGLTLAVLQDALARHGQWLPLDPPHPDRLTIAELLSTNASGPRRFGMGLVRDHLLGVQCVLADGRLIRSGGRVVKNVAGFDLLKLFIGARDSLGLIVEATFKLLPLPEAERFVQVTCGTLPELARLLDAIHDSELTPVVIDVHRGVVTSTPENPCCLVVGFAGTGAEVEWQTARAAELGLIEPAPLDYEAWFRVSAEPPRTISTLPSRLVQCIERLERIPFVARAGNGIIHHYAGPAPTSAEPQPALARRLKELFDPQHILPSLSA